MKIAALDTHDGKLTKAEREPLREGEPGEAVRVHPAPAGEVERHRVFLRSLRDALRPLAADEGMAAELALGLVASELGADRCFLAELDPPADRAELIRQFQRPETLALPAMLQPSLFPALLPPAGAPARVVDDAATDPGLGAAEKAALAALGVRAFVSVTAHGAESDPHCALVAATPAPRGWTAGEVWLIEEAAERLWIAISRCRHAAARSRAEDSRRRAEEKYQTLFDTIGEGLAIVELIRDGAGKVVDVVYREVNDAFERHTGWRNVRGKRRSEVAPIPDEEWLEGVDRVVRTGEAERWEAYSLNARRWYRCYLSRIGGEGSDLIVLIFENITGRKHRERNQALLNSVSEAMAGIEKVHLTMERLAARIGRHFDVPWCVMAEPSADLESLVVCHGWSAPAVAAFAGTHKLCDLLASEQVAKHLRGEATVVSDTRIDRRVSAAGCAALGIHSLVIAPLLRNGVCRFLLAIFDRNPRAWRDDEVELLRELVQRIWSRLERALGEEALRQSEAQLRALAAELQEADRRKNDFLAMLGHELRNPLAAIRGGVMLMRSERALPESRQAALPIVAEQVEHVERLVDDLLDLTRIVQGRVQLRREKIAVQDALRQALEMVRPQAEPEGFVIDVRVPAEPLEVFGDRVRLTQVFMNVLGNAVKYSGDSRRIEVFASREGDTVVVRVRDYGQGIAPEVLPRIFEPFVQAKPGLTLQAGLGLGLAVVRQLMRLHDGEVEALSEGEKLGSELVLRLPAFRPAAEEEPGSGSSPQAQNELAPGRAR